MDERRLIFGCENTGYSIDQVGYAITVGELMQILSDYDDDDQIILAFDGGYTYGTITAADDFRYEPDSDKYMIEIIDYI